MIALGGGQSATRVHGSAPPVTASADRVAAPAATSGGDPLATVVLGAGQATVVTSTLPSAPTGRSYVLWGLPAGGGAPQPWAPSTSPVPACTPDGWCCVIPATPYESLALSQERAGTLPAAPSKVLAAGVLTR